MNLCEKLTYNYEKSKFKKLKFSDRRSMKKHLPMCKKCRDYQTDSDTLDHLLRKLEDPNVKYVFSDNEKKLLKSKLKPQ